MALKRGEVVLVPFPFSDLRSTKVRPAVVVSSSLYHNVEPDLILGAITSKIVAASGSLDYVLHDWQSADLRQASAFKPVLFTLDPSRVLYRIGELTSADLLEIDIRRRRILEL